MKKFILLCGTILFCAVGALAQIQGDVRDQNDKSVPDVTLTATDADGRVAATVKSDERGFYAFKGLKKGKYKIEAKATGFRAEVFKDVEVIADVDDDKGGKDISNATRLEIVLTPEKAGQNPPNTQPAKDL